MYIIYTNILRSIISYIICNYAKCNIICNSINYIYILSLIIFKANNNNKSITYTCNINTYDINTSLKLLAHKYTHFLNSYYIQVLH